MHDTIVVKEVDITEAVTINKTIPEFDPYSREYFAERLKNTDNLVIAAYVHGNLAGYLIGYDRFHDDSFYCWMTGVDPVFRRKGVLTALMDYQAEWARKRGYAKIKIKTRNTLRAMLTFLVNYGFYFTEVVQYPDIRENRILLEKDV